MSEIISMTSGPQGSATSDEAFGGDESSAPSHELGQESSPEASDASGDANGEVDVPRGTNGEQNGDNRPKSAAQQAQQKQESRYERTKRERKEFQAQREAFRAQQAQFAQERAQFEESKKPKRDYSLKDLKKYRKEWAKEANQGIEGKAELVERADAEIEAMEEEERASRMVLELPKRGTPEHRQQWEAAERELAQQDPEFMKGGTRVDAKLREILSGPHADSYRNHPQGIYAAYDRAKRELLEDDVKSLRTENSQLKTELKRYTGLTSIGGGVPGRVGDGGVSSTADFAKLSSADMRKHLLAKSKKSNDSGWL
jgi:hypothetical protein